MITINDTTKFMIGLGVFEGFRLRENVRFEYRGQQNNLVGGKFLARLEKY